MTAKHELCQPAALTEQSVDILNRVFSQIRTVYSSEPIPELNVQNTRQNRTNHRKFIVRSELDVKHQLAAAGSKKYNKTQRRPTTPQSNQYNQSTSAAYSVNYQLYRHLSPQIKANFEMKKTEIPPVISSKFTLDCVGAMCALSEFNISGLNTNRLFRVYVWYPPGKKQVAYVKTMFRKIRAWLQIACSQATNATCYTDVSIYMFMTPYKKELPDSSSSPLPLGPEHINSAHTYACRSAVAENSIILFRKEEWFKVFVHESFHCLGLDFVSLVDETEEGRRVHQRLRTLFPGTSRIADYRIYEVYVEIWANIINVGFVAVEKNCSPIKLLIQAKRESVDALHLLNKERAFSIGQAAKILRHYHISYTNLLQVGNKDYPEEDTCVFSYHMVRAIVFSELNAFLKFMYTHNHNGSDHIVLASLEPVNLLLQYGDKSVMPFIDKVIAPCINGLRPITNNKVNHDSGFNVSDKSLRMTCIE
jgi:hypothetical protein